MSKRKTVVIGILGTTLDIGGKAARWDRWRPTVALAQHDDLLVHRLDLLHSKAATGLAQIVEADVVQVSPETQVARHQVEFSDPWDFQGVYATLADFAGRYRFDTEREDYLVHITTGTHVAQICLFLLTESREFPARLLQTSPPRRGDDRGGPGSISIIDLDLSKYDKLASRFRKEHAQGQSFLKAGIETKNRAFNQLIEEMEHIAIASKAPLLLLGPTGAGKSQLARRIYELKKARRQVAGAFAEVNCATLRGDAAMSALFGHTKGAFTGALQERAGLLRKADGGVLFLDEVGELGADEQAMLLRALESKAFYPMGSDREVTSDFQLLAGTNRDLGARVREGSFREDLLARINLWSFRLPALRERPEDIEPNLDFELELVSKLLGVRVTMSREARAQFLAWAAGWSWPGNFRDFNACLTRLGTLSRGGRITEGLVQAEIERAESTALATTEVEPGFLARSVLGPKRASKVDRFDLVQLEDVLSVCRRSATLSDAGRTLFAASLSQRTSRNDADRLRKYLARFDLEFKDLGARTQEN